MKIEINEQKILTEILERDGSLHEAIKKSVESRLIETVVSEIEEEYMGSTWHGMRKDEIKTRVLDEIAEAQKGMVIKILKEFYDSYRYKKSDLEILKKLKEFIGENS